jgi:predicted amidohydrolase
MLFIIKERVMRIWLIQMEPKLKDKGENISKMHSYLDHAVKEKVNLIAFPELALTGYTCRKDFFDLAEPIPGPSTKEIMEKAAKENIYVVFGMPELGDGYIYNSAPLFGPKGLVGVYRKIYLPNHIGARGVTYEEQMFFRPGNKLVAFETDFGTIGIEICYDIWFPEIARAYALCGAWFILNIAAAPIGVPEVFRLLSQVRAMESVCYFGLVNQVGPRKNLVFSGGSCVANYLGEIAVEGSIGEMANEEVIECQINSEEAERHRFYLPILRNIRLDIAEEYWKILKER